MLACEIPTGFKLSSIACTFSVTGKLVEETVSKSGVCDLYDEDTQHIPLRL
jgi:hypothetical protein